MKKQLEPITLYELALYFTVPTGIELHIVSRFDSTPVVKREFNTNIYCRQINSAISQKCLYFITKRNLYHYSIAHLLDSATTFSVWCILPCVKCTRPTEIVKTKISFISNAVNNTCK